MISIRFVTTFLGFAFTAFLVARASWVTGPVEVPALLWGSMILYLLTAWLCIFWGMPTGLKARSSSVTVARGSDRLPMWVCLFALAVSMVLPPMVTIGVGPDGLTEQYATWYIGGLGALMTILVIRRRPWPAWSGTAVLAGWSMFLLGPLPALGLGLVGSIVWVTGAQFFTNALDAAARDTERLGDLQRTASAVQAAQGGQQRERRIQVQRALAVAGPVLARTIASGGRLTEEERTEARIAEGRLRDELRGPRLLDADVRAALDAARRRGALVTVLDEGGLDELEESQLHEIRVQLAETLRSARSERLYIRTSSDDRVAVTVVGRASSTLGLSDEDSVDLWREIEHPGR
ncbi:hypothetical protein [Microbacterium caowuchunii]|uniref:Uncharacterized protein n=1 Tax=Microbacterium caowuchunii TaxID=2614638 RepID=A0A5N0TLE7_9MICO|nr:hypothetical protein [Microbacterium caowuchunii]KAA9135381.1 hypothetical protein F6B40_02325 [Microbacterium caowuchunii]